MNKIALKLGNFQGPGRLGNTSEYINDVGSALSLFDRVISMIIGFMTVVAGIWFIFQFIIGAFGWLTAAGDNKKIQDSQSKITNSIIGLAVVVAAVFIIDLIGTLLGLNILNPGDYIKTIF